MKTMKAQFSRHGRGRVTAAAAALTLLLASCGGSDDHYQWVTAVATIRDGSSPTSFGSLGSAGTQIKLLNIKPRAIECGTVEDNYEWNIILLGIPPDRVLHALVPQADVSALLQTGRYVYRSDYEARMLPYTVIPCQRFGLDFP